MLGDVYSHTAQLLSKLSAACFHAGQIATNLVASMGARRVIAMDVLEGTPWQSAVAGFLLIWAGCCMLYCLHACMFQLGGWLA